MHIAICYDCRVEESTAALLSSIANAMPDFDVSVHCVVPETDKDLQRRASKLGERLQLAVRVHAFSDQLLEGLPDRPGLPRATFRRLFLPSMLANICGHFLYLDTDTLVMNNLRTVFDGLEGAQNPFAAALNVSSSTLADEMSGIADVEKEFASNGYFNAGVMAVDVERWLTNDVTNRSLAFARRNVNRIRFGDQDALNFVCRGNICTLPFCWNYQVGSMDYIRRLSSLPKPSRREINKCFQEQKILHFAGGGKPWERKWYLPQRRLYYKCLVNAGTMTNTQATLIQLRNKLSAISLKAKNRLGRN